MAFDPVTLAAAIKLSGGGGGGAVDDVKVDGASVVTNGTANIPMASQSTPGAVCVYSGLGVGFGSGGNSKTLQISCASTAETKAGTNQVRPIVPNHQHEAAFYGLAKAAGDSTQAASSNAVGTYTDGAKAAIKSMLGISGGGGASAISDLSDVTISGATEGDVLTYNSDAEKWVNAAPVRECEFTEETVDEDTVLGMGGEYWFDSGIFYRNLCWLVIDGSYYGIAQIDLPEEGDQTVTFNNGDSYTQDTETGYWVKDAAT